MKNVKDMWDFPVMERVLFENANRVYPLMQARVEKLRGDGGCIRELL